VWPHLPQWSLSACCAMKTPGPHLGHSLLSLERELPSTL